MESLIWVWLILNNTKLQPEPSYIYQQYKIAEIFHSSIAGLQTPDLPGVKSETDPHTERTRRPKKGADHSRLVSGRCNKQGNLYRRLVLGAGVK